MYACMYACMYVCMYVCIYVCTYICVYVCMYACLYVCLSVSLSVCLSVCLCVYVCTYVRTYVRMYLCMSACMCVFRAGRCSHDPAKCVAGLRNAAGHALAEPGATSCATAYSGKGGFPRNKVDACHMRSDSWMEYSYHASSSPSRWYSL